MRIGVLFFCLTVVVLLLFYCLVIAMKIKVIEVKFSYDEMQRIAWFLFGFGSVCFFNWLTGLILLQNLVFGLGFFVLAVCSYIVAIFLVLGQGD